MCVCVRACVRACLRVCVRARVCIERERERECVCGGGGGGCRGRFGGPYIKTFENPSSILASVICHIILSLSMFFSFLKLLHCLLLSSLLSSSFSTLCAPSLLSFSLCLSL